MELILLADLSVPLRMNEIFVLYPFGVQDGTERRCSELSLSARPTWNNPEGKYSTQTCPSGRERFTFS